MERRTLLISNYNADCNAWNGVCYEFFDVIAGLETATIVAPDPVYANFDRWVPLSADLARYAGAQIRARLRHPRSPISPPRMQPVTLGEDFDLCLFMCQFARDIAEVEQVRHWRERSRFAAAFVLEAWTPELDRHRATLRLLDKFDHVFVMNASVIPALQRYTRTPVTFLPSAADSLAACPHPRNPARSIDVLSLGRRLPEVHEAMLDLAEADGLFYVYDLWKGLIARHWGDTRRANMDMMQRSRYAIVWDPCRDNPAKAPTIGPDRALTTRYFEAAAGGAIVLGSQAECPEFEALFDWPDAVVEIAPDGSTLARTLEALDADPDRAAAIRTRNVTNALRRHDWAYRWDGILDTFAFGRSPAHERRIAALERRARQVEKPSDWRYAVVSA